jgi:hypothetical protein
MNWSKNAKNRWNLIIPTEVESGNSCNTDRCLDSNFRWNDDTGQVNDDTGRLNDDTERVWAFLDRSRNAVYKLNGRFGTGIAYPLLKRPNGRFGGLREGSVTDLRTKDTREQ